MLSMNITASRIYGDIPMKTPKTLAGSIALLLIALAILGFGICPVSASAFQCQNSNSTTMHGQEHHFAFNSTQRATMTSSFITRLQNQGVDVSTVQTALQNNDTASVNLWLKSYFASHPAIMNNTTRSRWHQRNTTATQSS
jgi:hypothetical protein